MYAIAARLTTALALGAAVHSLAIAQTFPGKTVTLISNSTTGASEAAFRLTLDKIKENTGATFIFEPRAGGQGAPALQAVKRATPDGHVIGLSFASPLTVNPFVTPELDIDPIKDFAPVTKLMALGVAITAREDFPARDMKELIAYVKSRPGQVKFGYAGAGGLLWVAIFEEKLGMKLLPVPFKSSGESITLLLGSHIDMTTAISDTVTSQKGKLKALAWGGVQPSPKFPGVGLVSESVPGLALGTWFGVFAPAGTPAPTIAWLNREFVRAVRDPAVVKIIDGGGMEVVADSAEDFAKAFRQEVETNRDLVRKHNIKG
jgi:tripartite-type tricarboxylate transporter receptor subunit TctC